MTLLKTSWLSVLLLASLASNSFSATRTWDGDGNDTLFTNPANWDGNTTVPANGDVLNFGVTAGPPLVSFDFGTVFDAPSIEFLATAPAYNLTALTLFDSLNLTGTGTAILNSSSNRQTFSQDLLVSVGAPTQTWDGGSAGIVASSIDLGAGGTLTLTGSGTTSTTRNELRGSVQGSGNAGIVKSGEGSLYIAPTAFLDYAGSTQINSGTLILGASNLLPDDSNLILGGGTLDIAGFDEKTGKLSLAGNSTINFGISNTANLVFDASQMENWGAFTLTILNFTPGQDTLRFGTSSDALTIAQLANIRFDGITPAQIDANGFLSPVPEPSSALLMGIGALALGGLRRRRLAQA